MRISDWSSDVCSSDLAVDGEALPYFFATSRLPDCRTPEIELLHHRGDRIRYGRFNAPRDVEVGKKEKFLTPLAFQTPAAWLRALQAETDRRQAACCYTSTATARISTRRRRKPRRLRA